MRALTWIFAAAILVPTSAHAFCGFYVAGGDTPLVNDATQVVLMRSGTRTVLSMQNNYQGPPEAFAMVIPVPAVLHEGDVKTLPADVFEHVEQMGAPRLVEYWEQDPCRREELDDLQAGFYSLGASPLDVGAPGTGAGVRVEARFAVGEYEIVILSATDSTALDAWLREHRYRVPADAAALLRPYVETGMKFFVAKVDPAKVHFEAGRAVLSPLRFFYDADELALPIRLGMANSPGTQDLIVNILAPHQRYRVANYDNVTIPTNLDVRDAVRDHFPAFYAALFDATISGHPHAVVTEYAWQASSCDPCPGPTLTEAEMQTLGADVLGGSRDQPRRYDAFDFVLTRLHARYGKDVANDLVFAQADPLEGGREERDGTGALAQAARADSFNNFQARYAIRHPWLGPIRCAAPVRGVWGGPPQELATAGNAAARPAMGIAHAPRGQVQLASMLATDVPALAVHGAPEAPAKVATSSARGCGCSTDGGAAGAGLLAAVGLVLRRRRTIPRA